MYSCANQLEPSMSQQHIPHQLITHLDEFPNGDLEIRYNYPFGEHAMPEQVISVPAHMQSRQLREDLNTIRTLLRERIKVKPIRIPHEEVVPALEDAILTIVTRDERRSLPIARLYCNEVVEQLGTKIERESRLEGDEFTHEQRAVWTRIKQDINGRAWQAFQAKLAGGNTSSKK